MVEGSKVRVVMRMMGKRIEGTGRVTEREENRMGAWHFPSPFPSTAYNTYEPPIGCWSFAAPG